MPSLSKARSKSRAVVCKSNLKQVGLANALYLDNNDSWFNLFLRPANANGMRWAKNTSLRSYLGLGFEEVKLDDSQK